MSSKFQVKVIRFAGLDFCWNGKDFHEVKTSITHDLKLKTQNLTLSALGNLRKRQNPCLPFVVVLFLALPAWAQSVGSTPDAGQIKKSLLQNKKGLVAIQKKIRLEKKKQQQAQVQERNVLSRLQKVDQKLGSLKREKEANSRDLAETRDRIYRLQSEMGQNQAQLVESRKLLKQRLGALYRMSFRKPFLGGLLDSQSFADWARRLKFELLLAESNQKLLSHTLRHEDRLEKDSEQWTAEERRRNRILSVLGRQEKNYSQERAHRTVFLVSIRREQNLREQTIADLRERAQGLQQEVSNLLQKAAEARKTSVTPYQGVGLQVSRGRIPWPVSGKLLPEYSFGKHKDKEFNAVVENSGIQIQAPMGTPFHAVADGKVLYADWFKGYGKLVILDHGEGYYSLYAQASELSVAEGQKVLAGQVLGMVGDTGSLVGESLYFEIRKKGVPQDPVQWLKRHS